MLRIQCPFCGVRDETEFHFGGPAHAQRPPLEADDLTWTDYLFSQENPVGAHFERWSHVYGCGQWFNIARDTTSHAILATYRLDEPKPILERV